MKQDSFQFLQGQIIALTYAIDLAIKHHPMGRTVSVEIDAKLDGLSNSMLVNGAKDSADGVERIRLALQSAGGLGV